MGIIRPATPGFLVTLVATGLLAVVSFNVPILKSVFFLKATVDNGQINTSVTFGTLGYCAIVQGNTTCSKPSVGYELDINGLVGNDLPIQIPQVLVKWVTYALVLHIVALVLAAISSVFGLLAHVREMSMTYCSTCVSGFAASIALIAFIFDLVLFFLTKSRINAVDGGRAEFGTAVWLTLAAWVLLFFAGCFYGLGRCCIRRRPRGMDGEAPRPMPDNSYADQMRMDAINAEAKRKADQSASKKEAGLPAFPMHDPHERDPLTSKMSDSEYYEVGDQIMSLPPSNQRLAVGNNAVGAGVGAGVAAAAYGRDQQPQFSGGYARATPGTRTVDYYNGSPQHSPNYQPSRQASMNTAPSVYSDTYAPTAMTATATGGGYDTGYLDPHGHQQQLSGASYGAAYGHPTRGTSYHSAVSQPDNTAWNAPTTDPFAARTFNADTYNNMGYMAGHDASTNPYRAPERQYTLGGGYGDNVVPDMHAQSSYNPYPQYGSGSPAPSTSAYTTSSAPSAVPPPLPHPPQSPVGQGPSHFTTPPMPTARVDSPPPMYDMLESKPPGVWGEKGQRR